MNCPKCSAPLSDGDVFCTNCGFKLASEEQPSYAPPVVPQPTYEAPPVAPQQPVDVPPQPQQPVYGAPVQPPVQPTGAFANQAPIGAPAPINPYPPQKPVKAPKPAASGKKTGMILGIVGGVVALVLIIIIAGFFILKGQYSPEKTVDKLVSAMVESRWDDTYDLIGLTDTELVNKQSFVQMCQKDSRVFGVDLATVSDYDVKCYQGINGSYDAVVIFHHSGADDEMLNLKLNLEKDGFLFMDSYKLELENSPLVEYIVYAPVGSTVTINGVSLEYNDTEDEYSTGFYSVNEILPGDFELKISCNNCKDFSDKIKVYSDLELVKLEEEMENDYYGDYGYGYYDRELGRVVNGAYGNDYYACLEYNSDYVNEILDKIDSTSKTIFDDILNDTFVTSNYNFRDVDSADVSAEYVREFSEEYIYRDFSDVGYINDPPVLSSYEKDNESSSVLYASCYGVMLYEAYYDTEVYSKSTDYYTHETGKDWYYTSFNVDYIIQSDGSLKISGIYFDTEASYFY